MKVYNYIVVGGGITGLVMARILGLHGAKVLLLEKSACLGGSLRRFNVQGIPLNVGFHFTGGLTDQGTGVLDEMLTLLREFASAFGRSTIRIRLSWHALSLGQGASYLVPLGMDSFGQKLKADFPALGQGIDRYFHRFMEVVSHTPTLSVAGFREFPPALDDDCISLQQVLDQYIPDPLVKAILGEFCMCYGSSPSQVSFATHARISIGLHESLTRWKAGGRHLWMLWWRRWGVTVWRWARGWPSKSARISRIARPAASCSATARRSGLAPASSPFIRSKSWQFYPRNAIPTLSAAG